MRQARIATKREKIVFIIPGFRQNGSQKGYVALKKRLTSEGYTVVSVAIPWKDSTIVDNADYFLEKFEKKLVTIKKQAKQYINNKTH